MSRYKILLVYFNLWRIIPTYCLLMNSKFSEKAKKDLAVWSARICHQKSLALFHFGYCLIESKAYRSLVLNRLHRNPFSYAIVRLLFKPLDSLYINIPPEKIGGGLYFMHGFSTILAASEIGENCSINQQVTIGYAGGGQPIIGNNVIISAGAIVIGDITVNDGAVIGAGAVVTHDVARNDTVAGVPAVSIKSKVKRTIGE